MGEHSVEIINVLLGLNTLGLGVLGFFIRQWMVRIDKSLEDLHSSYDRLSSTMTKELRIFDRRLTRVETYLKIPPHEVESNNHTTED
jgi:hypothetical protein